MAKAEKRIARKAAIKFKIKELKQDLDRMKILKTTQKIPLVQVSIEMNMAFCQAQLENYESWLEQLEKLL